MCGVTVCGVTVCGVTVCGVTVQSAHVCVQNQGHLELHSAPRVAWPEHLERLTCLAMN